VHLVAARGQVITVGEPVVPNASGSLIATLVPAGATGERQSIQFTFTVGGADPPGDGWTAASLGIDDDGGTVKIVASIAQGDNPDGKRTSPST